MQAPSDCHEIFRIFVGSLSYEVDNHRLKECFQAFGNIKKALVIRDQRTGQSKGYGFITFSSRHSFERALAQPVYVNGRLADCHPVLTKGALKEQEKRDLSNKLFVGGISQSTKIEDLRNYFSNFGHIREARVLYDGKTGKSRGFGFVLFEDPSAIDRALFLPEHKIKNKKIEIKKFTKEQATNNEMHYTYANHQELFQEQEVYHSSRKQNNIKKEAPAGRNYTAAEKDRKKKSNKTKKPKYETQANRQDEKEKELCNEEYRKRITDFQGHTSSRYGNYSEKKTVLGSDTYYTSEENSPAPSKPNFTLSNFFASSEAYPSFNGGFSRGLYGGNLGYYQESHQSFYNQDFRDAAFTMY